MEIQSFLKFDELSNFDLPALIRQYREFKLKYFDFIVLFKVGNFYETYFNDAFIFSKLTGIVLTKRKLKIGNLPMAGVTYKNIGAYIGILLENNYKIVIIDEAEKKKDDEEICERKVSKIYTKGSLYELEYLNPSKNNYIASIYKNKNIYKIAYADVSTGAIYTSIGDYDETACELSRINPSELLVPKNLKSDSELYNAYKCEFLREDFYEGESDNKALTGLINYLKFILGNNIPKFEEIKEYDIKKLLLIDYLTRKNLELTKNAYNNNVEGSLLWALDYCKTPMGKRLLNSLISTPLYNIGEIQKRQNILLKTKEFKNEILDLGNILECIGDISRLTSKMSNKTITPLEFLTLKNGLEPLKNIFELSEKLKLGLSYQNKNEEKILKDYYYILDKTFEDDIEKVKNGDFIKQGANDELDILNDCHKKLLDELFEYEEYLKYETNIKSLKIGSKGGNYYIEINANSQNAVLGDFAVIQRLKNSIKYKTSKLIELEEKILSNEKKTKDLKNYIFENLRKYSTEMTEYIRNYSKNIALFDVCFSQIKACEKYNLNFAEINNQSGFEIKGLKHLAAEKIIGGFEPLDISLKNRFFVFLTGINGVGKSTFLKALGCLTVLVQAGLLAPVISCEIPIVNKLCAILNVSDELINKKSTHQMQMQSVSYAVKNLDDKSLLLMDEIGKNTSYKDGVALSYGIIKYLVEEKNINSLLSTHYIEIKDYTKPFEDKITFYKIEDENRCKKIKNGTIEKSFGIEIAKNENLPDKIIEYAKNLAENVL